MKFVIAFVLGLSSLALACPDFSGKYVLDGDRESTFTMTQTECSSLQVDANHAGRELSVTYIVDGHFHAMAEGFYVLSEMRADSMFVRSVTMTGDGFYASEDLSTMDEQGNINMLSNFYNDKGVLQGSQTAKLIRQK